MGSVKNYKRGTLTVYILIPVSVSNIFNFQLIELRPITAELRYTTDISENPSEWITVFDI